jgi:TonB C terminal
MKLPSKQKRTFRLLTLLSLMLHVGLYTAFMAFRQPTPTPTEPKSDTVSVKLRQAPKEILPKQIPSEERQEEIVEQEVAPEQHLPASTSEQFASDNQEDQTQTEIVAGGGEASKEPKEEVALGESEVIDDKNLAPTLTEELLVEDVQKSPVRELVSTVGSSDLRSTIKDEKKVENAGADALAEMIRRQEGRAKGSDKALDEELSIPKEYLEGYGNLALLSDMELREADVPQPFSEKKAKELELANKYLARMNAQVMNFWVNPYSGNKMIRGIIKVELGVDGYLRNATVYRSSGNTLLDISVLDAIRSVPRYDVPEDEVITARYYTNLSFHYSSLEERPELMPFEEGYAKLD